MIAAKTFREDLYFRLNVIELRLPPLRDWSDDIVPLASVFLEELARAPDAPPGIRYTLAEDASDALMAYSWPGNVRELHNRLRRAALLASRGQIRASHLGLEHAPGLRLAGAPDVQVRSPRATDEADPDRATIEAALARADWTVARAAAELGLTRQSLYRRMEKLGIAVERRIRGAGDA